MEPGAVVARAATGAASGTGKATAWRRRDDGHRRPSWRDPAEPTDVALAVCHFVLPDYTNVTGHRVVIDRD